MKIKEFVLISYIQHKFWILFLLVNFSLDVLYDLIKIFELYLWFCIKLFYNFSLLFWEPEVNYICCFRRIDLNKMLYFSKHRLLKCNDFLRLKRAILIVKSFKPYEKIFLDSFSFQICLKGHWKFLG